MTWSNLSSQKNGSSASFVQCPLCKRENYCIVFGINGGLFQQHYIDKGKKFAMTEAHKYGLMCYFQEQGGIYLQYDVNKYWRCQRYLWNNKWLERWLRKEIQALIQEEDVNVILHHVRLLFKSGEDVISKASLMIIDYIKESLGFIHLSKYGLSGILQSLFQHGLFCPGLQYDLLMRWYK